ncbi:MAG: FAD-dependent thymidylate synthase, partial [Spirochaetia bacterium]|nr:FAD-dependent thymidylate synthase [Spirochaetia bacterium]
MIDEHYTGSGQVMLLAGGGTIYTDIAARFVASERSLEEIAASPYSRKIVQNIISSGHRAALEFDYFIFGVAGYSRVTETQLVRKRLASYLIKSGRAELGGKRRFSVV